MINLLSRIFFFARLIYLQCFLMWHGAALSLVREVSRIDTTYVSGSEAMIY